MKHTKILGRLSLAVTLSAIISSCSYHLGTTGAGSAMITNDKFATIDFAYGTAKTVNAFGIGGNKKEALVLEAKRNLYLNYDLKPGQALGNITVDFKRTFFLFFLITKVTYSAEVIDFSANAQDLELSRANLQRFTNQPAQSEFDFGESIIYVQKGDTITGRILGSHKGRVIIQFFDANNNFKTKRVWPTQIRYTAKKTQPLNSSAPDKLYTPQNRTGKLIKFRYRGETYSGELMEVTGNTYLIRMESGDGKLIGLYVDQKDVIE